MFDDSENAIS